MFNNAGASQFAGGGFMASPGAQADGGTQKRGYDNKNQAVRAVTVKQIVAALDQAASDSVVIDGKEISNVSVAALWALPLVLLRPGAGPASGALCI